MALEGARHGSEMSERDDAVASPSRRGPRPLLVRWRVVLAVAVMAFAVAMTVSSTLFRYYSPILDEPVYVVQAKTLLRGDLTLPGDQARFHQPFFTGLRGDRLVFKYTPVWPAVLAASNILFGSMRLALGLTAAGAVVAMALFTHELTGDRRRATAAAALLALCPLFILHSALFLSYVFSLLCSLLFGWALLRGLRRRSRLPLVLAWRRGPGCSPGPTTRFSSPGRCWSTPASSIAVMRACWLGGRCGSPLPPLRSWRLRSPSTTT